jgi:HD-GYP domain-containing protein (c-di-GMP phosphodiesterase class II)
LRGGGAPAPQLSPVDQRHLMFTARQLPDGEALLVAEDLTALIREREQRESSLAALVSLLTGLIDARDPGSRGHSEKVAQVAAAIGRAQSLADPEIDGLQQAGALINIGKILVPAELLTKSQPLTEAEIATVRSAMARSAELLRPVPFQMPVADWIDGMDEADQILPSRILRIANGFVGMVSPRAHRPALAVDAALAQLAKAGAAEDQPIITALRFWLDTQGGRSKL